MKNTLLEQIIREELHNIQEQLGTVQPKTSTPKPTVKTNKAEKPKTKGSVKVAVKSALDKIKKSQSKVNVPLPPTDTIFHTTKEMKDFRNWKKSTHPTEWTSKLKNLDPYSAQTADVEMYVKYKNEYTAYLKKYNKTAPDDQSQKLNPVGSPITYGIYAIALISIAGTLSSTLLIKGLWNLIARRRNGGSAAAKNAKKYGKTYVPPTGMRLFLKTSVDQLLDQMAANPNMIKAEIDKIKSKSNNQMRREISELTDKLPTDAELNELRRALNDPHLVTSIIIAQRRNIFSKFLKGTRGITGQKVIDSMTATERKKYASYVRELEARRKRVQQQLKQRADDRRTYKPGETIEW